MYSVGDIVFYSSTGVCAVKDIGKPDLQGLPGDIDYYTLQPLSQNHREMIYVPVNTKAFMRYAITEQQAKEYMDCIKDIKPVFPQTRNPKGISDFYSRLIQSYDCKKLLQVIVSLTVKKRECQAKNKNLNQTQTIFLKRAGEMIYNEFALALNVSGEQIEQMIDNEIA